GFYDLPEGLRVTGVVGLDQVRSQLLRYPDAVADRLRGERVYPLAPGVDHDEERYPPAVDEQADVAAMAAVPALDHPLVEDDRVRAPVAHVRDHLRHVQQPFDLSHREPVVHRYDDGPPRVPVHYPFDPDVLSNHDFTLLSISSASSTPVFLCTIQAAAFTKSAGVRCWKAFRPMEIPAAPPAIAPSISSRVVRSSVLEPPATTTGTGQPLVTSRKDSGSPVYTVLTMSAPSSAATRAASLTCSRSFSFLMFLPLGYIMARSGMPHSMHSTATFPRSWSIAASDSAPMFTCIDTPSAPIFRAFVTEFTRTLLFGSGPTDVLADRWRISPTSRPLWRWPWSASPTWPITAFAPPSATRFTACDRSISPGIGPFVTPWSIGTMTVFLVLRSMILSRRISFPLITTTTSPCIHTRFFYAEPEGLLNTRNNS